MEIPETYEQLHSEFSFILEEIERDQKNPDAKVQLEIVRRAMYAGVGWLLFVARSVDRIRS